MVTQMLEPLARLLFQVVDFDEMRDNLARNIQRNIFKISLEFKKNFFHSKAPEIWKELFRKKEFRCTFLFPASRYNSFPNKDIYAG